MALAQRLDRILPRMTDPRFLGGEGIGNELACHIFDYPAAHELQVRAHLGWLLERLGSHHRELQVTHLDLLDEILAYLESRKLLEPALAMQATDGDARLLKTLNGFVDGKRVCRAIAGRHDLPGADLVLVSGVGSMWPMLRVHALLNSLHTVLDNTPLVLFYPGHYDRTSLRLFGHIRTETARPGAKHYYRAFPLIPHPSHP